MRNIIIMMGTILVCMKSINFKQIAMVIAVAEGLSFDVDQILAALFDIFAGGSTAGVPQQIIQEAYDAFQSLAKDPLGTAVNVGTNVAVVYASFKALGWLLSAIGAPKSKKVGGITVRWA